LKLDIVKHGQSPSLRVGHAAPCIDDQFTVQVGGDQRQRNQHTDSQRLVQGSPVSLAAYAVGYGNPANFSTAFRRCFGVTPKHVRLAV